jgi:signal transduction histidine kinase
VQINRQYDPDLPRIRAHGSELNQVWTNLIDNAVDAMDGQGKLTLITRCENDFVMVEVADNGPGIPPEVQAHIFEPFYTTKGAGFGTGLGLDISHRIVLQHDGTIEVRSEPRNTRFIVRLPVKGRESKGQADE